MEITEGAGLTEFEEGGFGLEVFHEGRVYMYHHCLSPATTTQILLPSEVESRDCMHCGSLKIPGELLILWEFLHEGREYTS
jgi:hypothetical protein